MRYDTKLPANLSSHFISAYSKHGANCVVLNSRREVLLLHRDNIPNISYPDYWCLPGGHVDPGESAIIAAVREVNEETGLVVGNVVWMESIENAANGALDQMFVAHVDACNDDIELGEGQEAGFFSYEETKSMLIVPNVLRQLERVFDPSIPKIVEPEARVFDFPDA